MESKPDTPPPGDPLEVLSDSHVEELLNQAEGLVGEIASAAGVDGPRETTGGPTGELGSIEPDPLSAVELTAMDIAEIRRAVESDEQAEHAAAEDPRTAMAAADTAASIEQPAGQQSPSPVAEHPLADANELPACVTVSAGDDPPPNPDAPERLPVHQPEDSSDPPEVAGEPQPLSGNQPSSSLGVADAATEPGAAPKRRLGLQRLAIAPLRFFWRGVGRTAGLAANLTGRIIVALDRPFAKLSPRAKNNLGIVGLITLLAGLAGLILPGMLAHNPYAEMEPRPSQEAVTAAPNR